MTDAVRAWNAVRSQLQMEMAKNTFDTWVADTTLVSYEDHVFTIGVKNAFARDWVESRLTSTVSGLLAGMMDHSVDVHFVLEQPSVSPSEPPSEDPVESISATETAPGEDMLLSIQRGLLEAYTRPDSALYFPGYWLRWVPYIGAAPFMTILAFRQALYLAENCFKESQYFAISAENVGEIIGVSGRTIRRQRDGYLTNSGKFIPPKLEWFLTVRKVDKVNYSADTQTFAREPHQYAFKQAPITPGDMENILEWLLENGLEKAPVKALQAAIAAQPKELIRFPLPKPTKLQLKTNPSSAKADLVANVLSYCPPSLERDIRKQVVDLAGKLQTRIIESDGQVKVPLYFLKHLRPYLDTTPSILVIYLRKKAYRNTNTGEIREQVTLKGGIRELATFLGVSRTSVYSHLPLEVDADEAEPIQDAKLLERRARIGQMISQIHRPTKGELALTVKTADILIPEHQEEYERCLAIINYFLENISPEDAAGLFDLLVKVNQVLAQDQENDQRNMPTKLSDNVHIGMSDNVSIDMSDDVHIDVSEIVSILLSEIVRVNASGNVQEWLKTVGKRPDIKYLKIKYIKHELLKNIILDLTTNLNSLTTSYLTTDIQNITWAEHLGRGWDFSLLFSNCRIDQNTQQALRLNNATPEALTSHLLYAYSLEGAGINQPVRYAIKQLLRPGDGDLGHSPRHDRLASLGPKGIQSLIRSTSISSMSRLKISQDIKGAQDWERLMSGHNSMAGILELGELLGILTIKYSA